LTRFAVSSPCVVPMRVRSTVITRRTASRRALALIATGLLAAGLAACASGSSPT